MKNQRRKNIKLNPTQGRLEIMCMLVGFFGAIGSVFYARWNTQRRKKRQGCYYEDPIPEDIDEMDRDRFMAAAYKNEK